MGGLFNEGLLCFLIKLGISSVGIIFGGKDEKG